MRENKTLEALKEQLDKNLSHAPGGLEATISIMQMHRERLMYRSLANLVENESTSSEVIILFWKELWAASEKDIPLHECKKLIRLIIDNPHGVSYITLASHIIQDILDLYSVKRSRFYGKVDVSRYLFDKISKADSSDIDIDAAIKLLILFDDDKSNYIAYSLAMSSAFPIDFVCKLSLDENPYAQQASFNRIHELRQRALELISEQTGENLHGAPDNLLWNLLQWSWLLGVSKQS
jgi:hypothetical protein